MFFTVSVNLVKGSKDIRDSYIMRVEVLDKVKQLAMLPDNENMTLRQVAEYYEVGVEVVRKTIQRHREELLSDGMKKLAGAELDEYKKSLSVNVPELHKVPSTQLMPRRAVLRMGMVLRNSKVAEKIRTYLLEAEENITGAQKEKIIFQGSWSDEIDHFIGERLRAESEKGIKLHDAIKQLSVEVGATPNQIKNYWYLGAQGKSPLRSRIKLHSYKSHTKQSKATCSKQITNEGFKDLFAFGDEQEKEKLIKQQNQLIQGLLSEMDQMRATQEAVMKDNDELKQMIKEMHAKLVK